MKKKIGVFGGTFDPVHFGHLNLIINLFEACHLDEILLFPTALSPFKAQKPAAAPIHHRIKMLQLATAPLPFCRIMDWETHTDQPSYTIDTVRRLAQDPSLELHLLIGEDHFATLNEWKDAEELIQLAPPLIGVRLLATRDTHQNKIKIPLFDVSGTLIRERLRKKYYCGHLLPALVLDYIQQHHLYC